MRKETVLMRMNCLMNGNSSASKQFLSSSLRGQTHAGTTINFRDFGSDIYSNASDVATYPFVVSQGGIIQFSSALAQLTAVYSGSSISSGTSGTPMTLYFTLVKENGGWVIDVIDTVSSTSCDGTTYSLPAETPTGSATPVTCDRKAKFLRFL